MSHELICSLDAAGARVRGAAVFSRAFVKLLSAFISGLEGPLVGGDFQRMSTATRRAALMLMVHDAVGGVDAAVVCAFNYCTNPRTLSYAMSFSASWLLLLCLLLCASWQLCQALHVRRRCTDGPQAQQPLSGRRRTCCAFALFVFNRCLCIFTLIGSSAGTPTAHRAPWI